MKVLRSVLITGTIAALTVAALAVKRGRLDRDALTKLTARQ